MSQNPPKRPSGGGGRRPSVPIRSETVCGDLCPAHMLPGPVVGAGASAAAVSRKRRCGRCACERYRRVVLEKPGLGLSARRSYQDLVADGFNLAYPSVRRFMAKLRGTGPLQPGPHGLRGGRGGEDQFRHGGVDRVAVPFRAFSEQNVGVGASAAPALLLPFAQPVPNRRGVCLAASRTRSREAGEAGREQGHGRR